jgi:hypothetical protein
MKITEHPMYEELVGQTAEEMRRELAMTTYVLDDLLNCRTLANNRVREARWMELVDAFIECPAKGDINQQQMRFGRKFEKLAAEFRLATDKADEFAGDGLRTLGWSDWRKRKA